MIEELEGEIFPDRRYRICYEKVAEFIAVTGDEPGRWTEAAPPGFAAALLFVVAPELLNDPRIDGAVIHGDQSFSWNGPLALEANLAVTGRVERVRARGDAAFVTFGLSAATEDGRPVVEGRSTFLVGPSHLPGALNPDSEAVQALPEPASRAANATVSDELPSPRSASRADLVRYAAATRDWNPIHWDHDTAVAAGLGGLVVHGLLQSSWLVQTAATAGHGDRPLASARLRYTAPLRPAQPAQVEGSLAGDSLELSLVAGGSRTVMGRFEVAR